MNRALKIVLGIVLVAVLAGGGVFAYVWITGGTGEASREIEADEVAVVAEEGQTVFRINAAESSVQFKLQEDLAGNRIDVIGVTNQVAGEIVVDFANPQNSEVGTIRINMRTLQTDNESRNRAIRGQILLTARDENEFSDFVPSEITGLPESVAVGDTFTFEVTGDFTAAGTTRPITFEVTVNVESEDRITGRAVAVVLHRDFNISIPPVPGVANISEEVELLLDFVATRVGEGEAAEEAEAADPIAPVATEEAQES